MEMIAAMFGGRDVKNGISTFCSSCDSFGSFGNNGNCCNPDNCGSLCSWS